MDEDQEHAATVWRSYSEWCCRQSRTLQCDPRAIGAAVVLIGLGAGVTEVRMHWTGFVHGVTDAVTVIAIAAAAALVWGATRIVASSAPVPEPEPGYESPVILAAQVLQAGHALPWVLTEDEAVPGCRLLSPAGITDPDDLAPDVPEDALSLATEAARLADGTLDLVVSSRGTIFELPETEDEDAL